MTPGLFRFGQDFGNGQADTQFFQRDETFADYRRDKENVLSRSPHRLSRAMDLDAQRFQACVWEWMCARLRDEHGLHLGSGSSHEERDFRALTMAIQEDFALLHRGTDGRDRLVLLSVCFPSGWRPEELLGRGFDAIHSPIPEFEALSNKGDKLVSAMIERGPYVRFVWTVTADDRLDHHPTEAPRDPWTKQSPGILRVERQVTVPFPSENGSLFLIRTYLYPFAELTAEARQTLAMSIQSLSPAVQRYKGFDEAVPLILSRLT